MSSIYFYEDGRPIPSWDLPKAIQEGRSFIRGSDQRVSAVDRSTGEVVYASDSDVDKYPDRYHRLNNEQNAEFERAKAAGQQPGQAFFEEVLGSATLGVGTRALDWAKGEEYAQDRQLRRQENPIASTAGNVTGMVVPGVAALRGAGTAAKVMGATPAGALAVGSEALGAAAARGAAKLGAGQTTQAAVRLGAAGATEAGVATVGQNFGDGARTAEELFAGAAENAGLGLLLGGALGAGISGAQQGSRALAKRLGATSMAPDLAMAAQSDRAIKEALVAGKKPPEWAIKAQTELAENATKSNSTMLRRYAEATAPERAPQAAAYNSRFAEDLAPLKKSIDELKDITSRSTRQAPDLDRVAREVVDVRPPVVKTQIEDLRNSVATTVYDLPKGSPAIPLMEGFDSGLAKLNLKAPAQARVGMLSLRQKTAQALERATKKGDLTAQGVHQANLMRLDQALDDVAVWGRAAESDAALSTANSNVTQSGLLWREQTKDLRKYYSEAVADDPRLPQLLNHLENEEIVTRAMLQKELVSAADKIKLEKGLNAIRETKGLLASTTTQAGAHNALAKTMREELEPTLMRSVVQAATGRTADIAGGIAGSLGGSIAGALGGVAAARAAATTVELGADAFLRPASTTTRVAKARALFNRIRKTESTMDGYINRTFRTYRGSTGPGDLEFKPLRPPGKGLVNTTAISALGATAAERRKEYNQQVERVRSLAQSPEAVTAWAERASEGIGDVAPQVASQIEVTAQRAVAFLLKKLPPEPSKDPLQPQLAKPWQSDQQVERMAQYLYTTKHPLYLLEQLEGGYLSQESVEAVREVYPELYRDIAAKVQKALLETKAPLHYSDQIQLSLLLGLPGSYFQDPKVLARTQTRWKNANKQEKKPPAPSTDKARTEQREAAMTQSEKLESRI